MPDPEPAYLRHSAFATPATATAVLTNGVVTAITVVIGVDTLYNIVYVVFFP